MDTAALALFCGILVVCVVGDISILWALAAGLVIFSAYAKWRGYSWKQLGRMILSGVGTAKNILIVFLLIGILTALWRSSGTIPVIICYAVRLIRPDTVLLMAFLLNCGVSVLTGTSFGTSATMGVICMTLATAMGIHPVLAGGAIVSGSFFGDRCSPVSSSALLVSELTKTDIFSNIRNMLHTAAVPFLACCAVYGILGRGTAAGAENLSTLFSGAFHLHWLALLPAAAILLLSALRVRVKAAMSVSILLALLLSVGLQHAEAGELFRLIVCGYQAAEPRLGAVLNGGGILSMARVAAIVCLSSAYAGIFQETGLLDRSQHHVEELSRRIGPYGATLCTAVVTGMLACNQTLSITLTYQLCGELEEGRDKTAINLEDTAVVIAPLVPWSIAGAMPVEAIGAPMGCLLAAYFLYLLPLWRVGCAVWNGYARRRSR